VAIKKSMLMKILKSARELGLTEYAVKLVIERFLRKDKDGYVIETPHCMFRRAARCIADIDREFGKTEDEIENFEQEIYNYFTKKEYISTRPLVNAGRPYPYQQLSSCYVLPIKDNLSSIFDTLQKAAFLQRWDSAAGIDFSPLRPKGDIIRSTGGVSSGPISFMKVFDEITTAISEGSTRRGANMGVLRVDHPDIEEFIKVKRMPGVLENFNISVSVTDDFMERVKKNKDYYLVNPRTGEKVKKVSARKIFRMIVESMWLCGDPGIIFIDEINRHNPTPHIGNISAVNLCGEQPLLPYESCNLCNINLKSMLKEEKKSSGKVVKVIDFDKLEKAVRSAVHFLDNTIEANHYLFKETEEIVKNGNRKIGVGIMGWADVLINLGIPYDSNDAFSLAEKLMKFIYEVANDASFLLSKERGFFQNYPGSMLEKEGIGPRRNACITTIAPTGNAAIIADCSHSIEPLYALAYTRVGLGRGKSFDKWENFKIINEAFMKIAEERGFLTDDLKKEILYTGSIQHIKELPDDIKELFKTALDIDPKDHVRMQASFQKYVDSAVSKTVNMKENCTREDIEEVIFLAYELKCKGITIYRDNSREKQILKTGVNG